MVLEMETCETNVDQRSRRYSTQELKGIVCCQGTNEVLFGLT